MCRYPGFPLRCGIPGYSYGVIHSYRQKFSQIVKSRLLLAGNGIYSMRGGLHEFDLCCRMCGKVERCRAHGAELLRPRPYSRRSPQGENLVDPRGRRETGADQQAADLAENTVGAAAGGTENAAARRHLSQAAGRYDLQLQSY